MVAAPNEQPQADPLAALIGDLAEKRNQRAAVTQAIKSAREALEKEIAPLHDTAAEIEEDVKSLERRVRDAGMQAFRDDPSGNPRPHPALQIKVFKRLRYDAARARLWALDHKLFLSFDAAAFEKVAKASPTQFDFVTIEEEPQVTIAGDLNKALGLLPGGSAEADPEDMTAAAPVHEIAQLRSLLGLKENERILRNPSADEVDR